MRYQQFAIDRVKDGKEAEGAGAGDEEAKKVPARFGLTTMMGEISHISRDSDHTLQARISESGVIH